MVIIWSYTDLLINPIDPFTAIPPAYIPDTGLSNLVFLFGAKRVTNPHHSAGVLNEPPISLPTPIGEQQDAINPLYPPELPPEALF